MVEVKEVHMSSAESDTSTSQDTNVESDTTDHSDAEDVKPLSSEEIKLVRLQLRTVLRDLSNKRNGGQASNKPTFRVPRDHPIFSGEPADLEPFIMEMELCHENDTSYENHNPGFLTQFARWDR